jgi:hypothetical protein
MLKKKIKKDLNLFSKFSKSEASFLTVFFYLPNRNPEKMDTLLQIFQQYSIRVEKIQNKKSLLELDNVIKIANFVGTSDQNISKSDFEYLSQFLIANVIVVAFFYQKRIWNVSRLQKLNTGSCQEPHYLEFPFFWNEQLHLCWKNWNQISF